MKTLNQIYLFILVLLIFSCQKAKFEKAFAISELIHYTSCEVIPCGETIAHENEDYFLQGTIYKVNIFENENRIILFETNEIESEKQTIEVIITKNQKNIFEKISRFIDKNESAIIYIRGKIKGKDFPINGNCVKGVYLEIDHTLDIRF